MPMKVGLAVILSLIASAASGQGRAVGENLIEHVPPDFTVGTRSSSGTLLMTEFVPQGETVTGWSELVTTQVFLAQRHRDSAAFLSQVGKRWLQSCPGSRPDTIRTGQSNGYMVSMTILKCEQSPRTGHAENTVFRAISGQDSFYLVQYAYRSTLDQGKLSKALAFMSTVTVCDTRSTDHPCP
jgi:hypothetical protein